MGWYETLPDWIKTKIQFEYETEALAWCMGKDIRQGKATDAEICASLYCAGLNGPLNYNAAQIYCYICTKMVAERGWTVPEEVRVTELTADQERELAEWRRDIYRKRGKAETQISKAMKEVFGKRRCGNKASDPPACSDMHMQQGVSA